MNTIPSDEFKLHDGIIAWVAIDSLYVPSTPVALLADSCLLPDACQFRVSDQLTEN